MQNLLLDRAVRVLYDDKVSYIRKKNIELERRYFSKNVNIGPFTNGLSYDANFANFKEIVKDANEYTIDNIFILIKECFLFSTGYDMMFKKKLEADAYTSVPIDNLIYPMLMDSVSLKYNDVSVLKEHPNFEDNIKDIDRLTYIYTELQSLLYFLYCNDFQFPNRWEDFYPNTYNDLIKILNESAMTIGDFLHSMIDFKCETMNDVFKEINNKELQIKYLSKVEELRDEKHKETNSFAHVNLPVTYFLDHTIEDFIEEKHNKSLVLDNNKSNTKKKIIL